MLRLREYQRAALDALDRHWDQGGGPGLVVLPTGAGKALVIAALIREWLERAPSARICVLTHVRELVVQNHGELLAYWPEAPAGIFSAGIGRREADAQVVFCSIQSVRDRAALFGAIDLVVIDEAHLVPRAGETGYGRFLAAARAGNPDLKVAGFTATPYRLDSGRLDEGEGRVFERIVTETLVGDLIHQGYLAPLVCKATALALDVTGVPKRGGDYIPSALEAAVNREWITRAAVEEMVGYGRERRAWLAFCAGLAHAESVRDAIRAEGFSCETVTAETGKRERDRIVREFRAGNIRCLASVGVLSTGFNVPEVDLIALLRPTQSAGLYVQQVGRALRRAPGKSDAIVLDYAGLVRMHGPVDAVSARSVALGPAAPGIGRAKPCPGCGALIALNASTCEACWVEPDSEEDEAPHAASAEDALPILSEAISPWREVTGWHLDRGPGGSGPERLEVALRWRGGGCRVEVCLEHSGHAREKAVSWWRGFGGAEPVPMSVAAALERADELERPEALKIDTAGRLSESVTVRFSDGRRFRDLRRWGGLAA
ncbi:helicase domain protein [Methylorubrum populi BJ001]|jgi:DNA repair protein RadD|uniref:Helicase domain protein n=1 Tax=Methylorubrum populi (strain ATCC BAA-705 / NCIMB 13946 / BJ001) TaxID=441620 RepID=B1ZEN1_METPB|nr:DEAD/DEAH box helicase [Methylorubrum populi]ACB81094.1 helicase domain protein [Methylorubrum populi BJ001]OAH33720.1 helicase [Methylorubrum populi]PZP73221.1 MAG: ATP-dependent helicase [Methylorubrum populi]